MTSQAGQGIGRDKVVEIISSVIKKVEEAGDNSRDTIYKELQDLRSLIEKTRQDIGNTRIGEIGGKHIPSATDELDAVVLATEVATGAIMDGCDGIAAQISALPQANQDAIMGDITKIMEACSFQDITGQRITKVVKSLKHIDEKVTALLAILDAGSHAEGDEDTRVGDARLLNGPQMPDKAISQEDIDKLLADLF